MELIQARNEDSVYPLPQARRHPVDCGQSDRPGVSVFQRAEPGRRFCRRHHGAVEVSTKTTIPDIRQALEAIQLGGSTIQDFGQEGANEFLVRVEKAGVEVAALSDQMKKALAE